MATARLTIKTSRVKKLLRWCAYLVLSVMLLCGIAYVAHGLHGAAHLAKAKRDAAASLASALPASEQKASRDRDTIRADVAARWGAPAYSWQELFCELESRDAGWIVESYEQQCWILSVDLIPVASTGSTECDLLPFEDIASIGASGTGSATEPMSSLVMQRGPASALSTSRYARGCRGGLLAPWTSGSSRMLSGSRPESLDQSREWLVVTVSTEVSTTDLGCDPWAVIFCSEPVDQSDLEVG